MKIPMILAIVFYTMLACLFIGGMLHNAHRPPPNPFKDEDNDDRIF